jgi:hypothetical protein
MVGGGATLSMKPAEEEQTVFSSTWLFSSLVRGSAPERECASCCLRFLGVASTTESAWDRLSVPGRSLLTAGEISSTLILRLGALVIPDLELFDAGGMSNPAAWSFEACLRATSTAKLSLGCTAPNSVRGIVGVRVRNIRLLGGSTDGRSMLGLNMKKEVM